MPDSWWIVLGWFLVGIAAALLIWGRRRSTRQWRQRMQRRCPRCWYDMSRTEGLICSECGRKARSERQLYRCRRRRVPAIVAILLFLFAWASLMVPGVRKEGWVAKVPTTALMTFVPAIANDSRLPVAQFRNLSKPTRVDVRLTRELVRRCKEGQPWDWQWQLLIERILGDDPHRLLPYGGQVGVPLNNYAELLVMARQGGHMSDDQLARADAASYLAFDLRTDWPIDAPVYTRATPLHWDRGDVWYVVRDRLTGTLLIADIYQYKLGGIPVSYGGLWTPVIWRERQKFVGTARPELVAVALEVSLSVREDDGQWRPVRTYDVDVPLSVHGEVGDYVRSVSSDEVTDAIQAMPAPALHDDVGDGMNTLELNFNAVAQPLQDAGIDSLALGIELLDGEMIVATGAAWWHVISFGSGRTLSPAMLGQARCFVPLTVAEGVSLPADVTALTVRLTGDPVVALRDREQTVCWQGEVTLPVRR